MTLVKICGITSIEDAEAAAAAGADFVGVVFAAESPRRIDPMRARAIRDALPDGKPSLIGVFVREDAIQLGIVAEAAKLDYIQLHGKYTPEDLAMIAHTTGGRRVIRALRAGIDDPESALATDPPPFALLLDTPHPDGSFAGGSGRAFDWGLARDSARRARIFLAGGLTPDNVGAAIRAVEPFAVDVSSGVESIPGRKDPKLVRAFIAAARSAHASSAGVRSFDPRAARKDAGP